jgi:hypothetical protein
MLHQILPMVILGGQNLMDVLQKDELFDKLNTKGELTFQNHTLLLQLWLFMFPHNYSK